jgi:SAM-dependent methyltransferase
MRPLPVPIDLSMAIAQQPKRIARACDRRLQRFLRRRLERRLGGVEIAGWGFLEDRGVDPSERAAYGWSPWLPIHLALKRLRPGPGDVIADLGCGKGQAVLVAARMPFGRVVGVEITDEWSAVAAANVERARPRLTAPDVGIVRADVLEWDVPDDLSVVYMYCPFIGTVFEAAVERIVASYDRRPRPLRLVYNYPWEHNRLLASGRVSVVDVQPAQWPPRPRWWMRPEVIVTYEVHAEGGRPALAPARPRRALRRALERWSVPNDTRYVWEYPARDQPPLYSDALQSADSPVV